MFVNDVTPMNVTGDKHKGCPPWQPRQGHDHYVRRCPDEYNGHVAATAETAEFHVVVTFVGSLMIITATWFPSMNIIFLYSANFSCLLSWGACKRGIHIQSHPAIVHPTSHM
jgi:hypothetical protein